MIYNEPTISRLPTIWRGAQSIEARTISEAAGQQVRPTRARYGCGWGGLLRRLVSEGGSQAAVGLTSSPPGRAGMRRNPRPDRGSEEKLAREPPTDWPYDAIISIGDSSISSIPTWERAEKLEAYGEFFFSPLVRCGSVPGGVVDPDDSLTRLTERFYPSAANRPQSRKGSSRGFFFESDLPMNLGALPRGRRIFRALRDGTNGSTIPNPFDSPLEAHLMAKHGEAGGPGGRGEVEDCRKYSGTRSAEALTPVSSCMRG